MNLKKIVIIMLLFFNMLSNVSIAYSANTDKTLLELIKFCPDGRPTFSKALSQKGIFPPCIIKLVNNNNLKVKNNVKTEISYTYYNHISKFNNGRSGFSTQEIEFDKNGNEIKATYYDSNTGENYFAQNFIYDKNNNLIEIYSQYNSKSAPFIIILKNKYDGNNNLIKKELYNNNGTYQGNTKFTYDKNNNLIQKDENNLKKHEYQYDSNNNLVEHICYDYYSINYIFDFIFPVFETKKDITAFKYDNNNKLLEESRNVYGEKFDDRTFKYDNKGNLTEYNVSGKSHNEKITYNYEDSTIEIVHIDTQTNKIKEKTIASKNNNYYEICSYDSTGKETNQLIFTIDNQGNIFLIEEMILTVMSPYKRIYKYDKNGLKKECIMKYKSGKIGEFTKYIYHFF